MFELPDDGSGARAPRQQGPGARVQMHVYDPLTGRCSFPGCETVHGDEADRADAARVLVPDLGDRD
jgi:hypothetical protein